MVLELKATTACKCIMDCFIYHSKHQQEEKGEKNMWGCIRELIFPGVLRKMRRFIFRHNSIPVQLRTATALSGLQSLRLSHVY